jgi:hypothetical protein
MVPSVKPTSGSGLVGRQSRGARSALVREEAVTVPRRWKALLCSFLTMGAVAIPAAPLELKIDLYSIEMLEMTRPTKATKIPPVWALFAPRFLTGDFGLGGEPDAVEVPDLRCRFDYLGKDGEPAELETTYGLKFFRSQPFGSEFGYFTDECFNDCSIALGDSLDEVGGGVSYVGLTAGPEGRSKVDRVIEQCDLEVDMRFFFGSAPTVSMRDIEAAPFDAAVWTAMGTLNSSAAAPKVKSRVKVGAAQLQSDKKIPLKGSPSLSAAIVHPAAAEVPEVMITAFAVKGTKPVKNAKIKLTVEVYAEDGSLLADTKSVLKTGKDGAAEEMLEVPELRAAGSSKVAIVATGTGKNPKKITRWSLGVSTIEPPPE